MLLNEMVCMCNGIRKLTLFCLVWYLVLLVLEAISELNQITLAYLFRLQKVPSCIHILKIQYQIEFYSGDGSHVPMCSLLMYILYSVSISNRSV